MDSTAPNAPPSPVLPTPPAASPAPAAPRRRRWILRAVLLALLGVGTVLLACLVLLRSQPGYVQRYQAFKASTTPQERKRIAEDLESRFAAAMSPQPTGLETRAGTAGRTGPAGATSVSVASVSGPPSPNLPAPQEDIRILTITVPEANAWLTERFPDWCRNRKWQPPSFLSEPKVGIDGDRVKLGFRYHVRDITQDITMVFAPRTLPDGRLQLELQRIDGGRLPLPMVRDTLTGKLREQAEQQKHAKLREVANAIEGEPFDPVDEDADARTRRRLLNIEVLDDAVRLTLKYEPKPPKSANASTR